MAESPFGPDATNRMIARLCHTVNMAGQAPAVDLTEDDWLPGIRSYKPE